MCRVVGSWTAREAADHIETSLDAERIGRIDREDLPVIALSILGTEAVRALRKIREAYYADADLWGTVGIAEDDARRFMQAYERVMMTASPELQKAVMVREPDPPTTLEVP